MAERDEDDPIDDDQDNGKNKEESGGTAGEIEVLTEEYNCYRIVAESIIRNFKRPKDAEVSNEILKACDVLISAEDLRAKKSANEFFRFFLKVLKWVSNNQPLSVYKNWYKNEIGLSSSPWVEQNKSYVFAKTMDDGSIIIYTSIATSPEQGWQENGLRALHASKQKKKK